MTRTRTLTGTMAFSAVMLLTQACGGSSAPPAGPLELDPISIPTAGPSPQARATPEDTEATSAPIGAVVYEHDFSSPSGGLLGGQSSETAGNEFGTRFAEYTAEGT